MAITNATRDGDAIAEMNTTPLIDVMLVLLTLLIITLPLQTNAVKLDLPRDTRSHVPPPVVTLAIDFDGTVTWNSAAVDRAALDADLARAAAQDPQPDIHVVADRLAKYDVVARVLADAARAGATHIGFANMQDFRR
ncbi:MAG TPA: biopolymer transporter ExbD [Rhizomicrobium sp.]|nr:biopolymer transporter ExbD [Rhizomicrobium sp.]